MHTYVLACKHNYINRKNPIQIPQLVIVKRKSKLTEGFWYQNDCYELYLESYLRNKWPCHQEHTIYNSLSFFSINSYSAYAGLGARR